MPDMHASTRGLQRGAHTRAQVPRQRSSTEPTAEDLLSSLRREPEGSEHARDLCTRIVTLYKPVIVREARRYRNRGVPEEDLRQVAMLGLMKAIRNFDPDHGKPFISYLLPTMTGELKRHFRDNTWAVHAPRAHQERRGELNRFTAEFSQTNGRAPTISEIGAHLGLDPRATSDVINACAAYSALSLDRPYTANSEGEDTVLGDTIGGEDRDLEMVVDREALKKALIAIPARERRILVLRFFGEKTQAEIAEVMGCSQMHISRLLATTLKQLRRALATET